jgi:acid stress-induced BolA-like protein IbaG/YrbA
VSVFDVYTGSSEPIIALFDVRRYTASLTPRASTCFIIICSSISSFGSPTNTGTHYKVILVSNEFEFTESDAGRKGMVDVVLAEQLQGPSQAVKVNTLAMTPAEHARVMSKYESPGQWVAMVLESSSDESPTQGKK